MAKVKGLSLAAVLVLISTIPQLAAAVTVPLSGSGSMTRSYQYLAPNAATPTDYSVDYLLAVPGQYIFSNQFLAQQSASNVLATSSAVGGYSFMDSYRFAVSTAASGDALVVSLGLGQTFDISNLQMRLYDVTAASQQAPIVPGVPSGSQVLTPWIGTPGSSTTSITATFYNLVAGRTYLLDIAGIADGLAGGTYVGQMNLQAVPLPGAAWLLISGLGGIGLFRRRKVAAPLAT